MFRSWPPPPGRKAAVTVIIHRELRNENNCFRLYEEFGRLFLKVLPLYNIKHQFLLWNLLMQPGPWTTIKISQRKWNICRSREIYVSSTITPTLSSLFPLQYFNSKRNHNIPLPLCLLFQHASLQSFSHPFRHLLSLSFVSTYFSNSSPFSNNPLLGI